MHLTARLIILLSAAIVIAVIGLGCGSDGGAISASNSTGASVDGSNSGGSSGREQESNSSRESTTEARPGAPTVARSSLSKAAFIRQAGAICRQKGEETLRELDTYVEKHGSEGLSEEVVLANALRAVVLPATEAEISAVSKLGAPAGDKEEVEALLAAQQEAVDEVRELKELKSLGEAAEHFEDATNGFKEYGAGLAACGKSG
jgi:hypothetical protein